jgi:hypothetical protein
MFSAFTPRYIPEWKGRIIVQAPSFRMTLGIFLFVAIKIYSSTPFAFHHLWRAYNYGLVLISCQNHVFHFLEIDQFGCAKIKRNFTYFTNCLALGRRIYCFARIIFCGSHRPPRKLVC